MTSSNQGIIGAESMKQPSIADSASTGHTLWHERFRALVQFARSLSWLDDRADFYKDLALNLRKASGADSVNIRLLSPARDSFVLYAFNGDVEQSVNKEYGILSAGAGRMPQLIETGEPIVFDFANPASDDVLWDRGVDDGFSSALIIALPGARGILGAADLLFHEPRSWSAEDIEWFKDLGGFLGAVIGNALLSDNMMSLRIADERRSLSNEIHDCVAQSLSVISLETESALDSLAHGDMEMLARNLDLIKRAGSEADSAVRGQMRNLLTTVEPGEDPTIEQLVEMGNLFCAQWGLPCDVALGEGMTGLVIPKRIMTQLIRVVNEALVNVMRHAKAGAVKVGYTLQDGGLRISIEDDGVGFDPGSVGSEHLGLRIMRERLSAIGASLEVKSAPGNGTCLDIAVPFLV